jgi:diadenosine tetraphosphate (Ap4A) HIT family hydrolase
MKDCIFCKLANDRSKQLYRDKVCYVVLDKFPADPGHLLVVTNKHYKNIMEVPDPVVAQVFKVAKKFFKKINKKLKPTGGSVITNMGPGHIAHLHVHVIPRYPNSRKIQYPPRTHIKIRHATELFKKLRE